MDTLLKLHRILKPRYGAFAKPILLAYGCLIMRIALAALSPWPLKLILDHVLLSQPLPPSLSFWGAGVQDHPLAAIAVLALAMVLIKLTVALFSYWNKVLISSVGHLMVADLRAQAFAHLQRLSLSFHQQTQSSEIVYRLTSDIAAMRRVVVDTLQNVVRRTLTIGLMGGILIALDWRLGLTVAGIVLAATLFTRRYSQRVHDMFKQQRKLMGRLAAFTAESVRASALIQSYNQQQERADQFERQNRQNLEFKRRAISFSQSFRQWKAVAHAIGTALVIYFGANAVLDGGMLPGTLIVFVNYLQKLYSAASQLSNAALRWAQNRSAIDRFLALVQTDLVAKDAPDARRLQAFERAIEFRNVEFSYEQQMPALHNVSFTIQAGQTVALVGASGAGKTTLLGLLLRFYDPQQGRILIDGTDIRHYQLDSLRASISVVLQDALLLNRSVRENIAIGLPSASHQQIVSAAKRAQAHEFIENFPSGYDTLITEAGSNLSQGQRQRLSIARAILKQAPIVLLDEPGQGLDLQAESKLMAAVENLTRHQTVIMIAHRFDTLKHADRILVLDQGRLVEQGTHEALMKSNTQYQRLYREQMAHAAG